MMTTATESFRQNATDNLVVHKLPFDIIYFAHNSRRNGIANAEPERSPAAWLHRNVGHHSRCIFIYVYQVKYTQTHTHSEIFTQTLTHTPRAKCLKLTYETSQCTQRYFQLFHHYHRHHCACERRLRRRQRHRCVSSARPTNSRCKCMCCFDFYV